MVITLGLHTRHLQGVGAAAVIPALSYYLSAGVAIDLYERAHGIRGLPREAIPSLWRTLWTGWPYLVVIGLIVLVAVLVLRFRRGAVRPAVDAAPDGPTAEAIDAAERRTDARHELPAGME